MASPTVLSEQSAIRYQSMRVNVTTTTTVPEYLRSIICCERFVKSEKYNSCGVALVLASITYPGSAFWPMLHAVGLRRCFRHFPTRRGQQML